MGLVLTIDTSPLSDLTGEARRLGGQVVRASAENVRGRAVEAIQDGPKTGRIYEKGEQAVSFTTKDGKAVAFTARKGKASRIHQASAPGEAPATDEGLLVNSIQTFMGGDLSAEVVVGAEYGATLELGSLDGKISPRPFLGPAVEAERPAFEAAAGAVLRRAGKG